MNFQYIDLQLPFKVADGQEQPMQLRWL